MENRNRRSSPPKAEPPPFSPDYAWLSQVVPDVLGEGAGALCGVCKGEPHDQGRDTTGPQEGRGIIEGRRITGNGERRQFAPLANLGCDLWFRLDDRHGPGDLTVRILRKLQQPKTEQRQSGQPRRRPDSARINHRTPQSEIDRTEFSATATDAVRGVPCPEDKVSGLRPRCVYRLIAALEFLRWPLGLYKSR